VKVDCLVSFARRAEVIVVADWSVERLMVEEPTTTKSLELPDSVLTIGEDVAGTSMEVAMCDVTIEPSALVVVTVTEVGSSVELGTEDALVEVVVDVDGVDRLLLVDVDVEELLGEELLVGDVVVGGVLLVPWLLLVDVVDDAVDDVDAPVPTTCLFGMMPSGMASALI
jgi:hypothetical protein